ncbi:MAG: hypothetical protein AB7G28_17035 [Pirellulales bacterium]
MQELLIILASMSLGGLAWQMLVISDWLLGEGPPKEPRFDRSGRRRLSAMNLKFRTPQEPQILRTT